MKHLATAAVFFALASHAAASAPKICRTGSQDIFSVSDYAATSEDRGFGKELRIEFMLRNETGRGVRMVDGIVAFVDVLGRVALMAAIDPDTKLASGATITQSGIYSNLRLLEVQREDVLVAACITGLVYDDGEVVKFRQ